MMRIVERRFRANSLAWTLAWATGALGAVACANGVDAGQREVTGSGSSGAFLTSGAGGSLDGTGSAGTAGSTGGNTGMATTGTGGEAGARASGGASGSGGSGGSPGSAGSGGSGPAASTQLPFHDDFEDGDPNGWMASIDAEQMPLGKWSIVADGATKVYEEQQATSDPSWAVGGDYRWTDQHLEAKVKVVSGFPDTLVMLVVRFTSFKTYCFLEVRSNQMKIRVKVDGSTTDVGTYKFPTALVDGTWYTVGISAKGSTIAAYFAGAQVAMGSNSSVTAGGIALTATDGVVAFDDVAVTAP